MPPHASTVYPGTVDSHKKLTVTHPLPVIPNWDAAANERSSADGLSTQRPIWSAPPACPLKLPSRFLQFETVLYPLSYAAWGSGVPCAKSPNLRRGRGYLRSAGSQ